MPDNIPAYVIVDHIRQRGGRASSWDCLDARNQPRRTNWFEFRQREGVHVYFYDMYLDVVATRTRMILGYICYLYTYESLQKVRVAFI